MNTGAQGGPTDIFGFESSYGLGLRLVLISRWVLGLIRVEALGFGDTWPYLTEP